MAKLPNTGAQDFPVTQNQFYGLVEKIAMQQIRGIKSANRLEDALYFYEIDNGTVIEQALIEKAKCKAYDPNAWQPLPSDPKVHPRYFNNWEQCQFITTTRYNEIRKIIAKNGVQSTAEQVAAEIVDSITQGEGSQDFKDTRSLILNANVYNYVEQLGGVPTNMKGVLYAVRDMYEALRSDNDYLTGMGVDSATPERDIRIAISTKVLNLIDVVELANTFNLSKEEMFGKIVVVPVSDIDEENWYKIVVYDRMAFGRATRLYEYGQEYSARGLYMNHLLTVDRMYFYSNLFKAASIDVTKAATAARGTIITASSDSELQAIKAANAALKTSPAQPPAAQSRAATK